jgi:hypothetical protein
MALEATYFGGATISSDAYPDVKIASSWTGAFKFGWEF